MATAKSGRSIFSKGSSKRIVGGPKVTQPTQNGRSVFKKGSSKRTASGRKVEQRHDAPLHSKKVRVRPDPPRDITPLKLSAIRPPLAPRGIQFDLMWDLAKKFGLRPKDGSSAPSADDQAAFDAAWAVSRVWRRLSHDLARKSYIGLSLDGPTEEAFEKVRQICASGQGLPVDGYRHVNRRDIAGKFVVFSDHHRSVDAERQNFFSKNNALYVEALRAYSDQGYTVVENGDTEELIVRQIGRAHV